LSNDKNEVLIEEPKLIGRLTNYDVINGTAIPAIDRLKLVSAEEFEDIIREWLTGHKKNEYYRIRRSGGAGDMGRDVIAYIDKSGKWDNYQCKHYDHSLTPTDIYTEIGKLCYYTFKKEFTIPEKYIFVSPQGVGSKLGNFLDDPNKLKNEFLNSWDKVCKNNIKSKTEIELSEDLSSHIDNLNFDIFQYLDPQKLIEEHEKTNYFAARFGGGLKRRPTPSSAPQNIQKKELRYVEQLYEAYGDHKKYKIHSLEILKKHSDLFNHFNRQRECFYCAESLNEFSRDQLPLGNTSFNDLKYEVFTGVIDIANSDFKDGFARVIATINEANKLSLTSNPLIFVSTIQDKTGICHHLANENKLKWIKPK